MSDPTAPDSAVLQDLRRVAYTHKTEPFLTDEGMPLKRQDFTVVLKASPCCTRIPLTSGVGNEGSKSASVDVVLANHSLPSHCDAGGGGNL